MGGAKTIQIMEFGKGMRYYSGQGVPEDKREAVKWFRKATEQELVVAKYNLGWCYFNGNGVPENKTEAVKWYRKAAEQGYEDAISFLREIDSAVATTPEQAAHLRVLAAYRQVDLEIPPGASQEEKIAALRSVHSRLSAISLSGCSSEFRSDFIALINSVAQFIAAVVEQNVALAETLPGDPVGGFFMGMINALGGEADGGVSRMRNDLKQTDQGARNALEEWRRAETALKKYE
jgi:TPR repeat protein